MQNAELHQGSWWEDWHAWLGKNCGAQQTPPSMGAKDYPALEDAPEKCNSDPYGEGWLMKVNVSRKPEGLMDAAAYEAFCATEGH